MEILVVVGFRFQHLGECHWSRKYEHFDKVIGESFGLFSVCSLPIVHCYFELEDYAAVVLFYELPSIGNSRKFLWVIEVEGNVEWHRFYVHVEFFLVVRWRG
jgi:hypothetical protein